MGCKYNYLVAHTIIVCMFYTLKCYVGIYVNCYYLFSRDLYNNT